MVGGDGGSTLPAQQKCIKTSHVRNHECTKFRQIFTRNLTSNISECTKCRKRVWFNDYNTTNPTDPINFMPTSPNNIIHSKTNPNAKQGNHWIK